ncbi:MAG: glutamate--tRNA ligase [Oscillibacter sp.]|nr:glutamate--tRNA ligase [Oscillibacter sp.]
MSKAVAEKLFPHITKTDQDYETLYPPREGVCVRFAPSPTGFMHIGGLYTALVNSLFAKGAGEQGAFLLRIEDTDQKRQLENGVTEIIQTLDAFDIHFDEGASGETSDKGAYGPYRQSHRREIYQAFAKHLVEQDLAYPCFCTEEELTALRDRQEAENALQKGYFGKWARCRDLDEAAVLEKLDQGQRCVIRMKSRGTEGTSRVYHDIIRGDISMQENILDAVILKSDGLPTYHFAHVVDDHLMRTTDVIRADEWIASIPLHVEMFEMLGFPVPHYAHLSPIMKLEEHEGGVSRRKLSKRKDPEARVRYYEEAGYPIQAVLDYLLNISSAAYEPWREEHMDASIFDFPLDLTKTGVAGALFDFDKLNNIARKRIAHLSCQEVFDLSRAWAKTYAPKLSAFIEAHPETYLRSIPVWHDSRLDVARWSDLLELYPYLYDQEYRPGSEPLPESFDAHRAFIPKLLGDYLETFDYADDSNAWFGKVREIASKYQYAVKMGPYKKHPEDYNGSIADVSSFIRFAVTGRLNTPDLHAVIHVLGEEEARRRVEAFLQRLA